MQSPNINYIIYKSLEDIAKQKYKEGVITSYDADEFGRIALAMFPHETLISEDSVQRYNSEICIDDLEANTPQSIDQLDLDDITTADLAIKKSDIMPQEVPDNLPSSEEYQKRSEEYANEHFKINMMQYSGPHYRCPMCQEGGMCRDETVNLLSYPPKHKYVCNKCNFVDYKNI